MKWGVFAVVFFASLLVLTSCSKQEKIDVDCKVDCPAVLINFTEPEKAVTENISSVVPGPCDEETEQGAKDLCLADLGKKTGSDIYCENITDWSRKIICYQASAKKSRNASICTKIKIDYQRDQCYSGVAIAKDDFLMCYSILDPSIRINCISKMDLEGVDWNVCASLWTAEERGDCRDRVKNAN